MNCQELKKDIEELETLYNQLRDSFEASSESGQGKIELIDALNEANKSVDEMLERYLPDFKEHNPELFKWRLGEKIEGINHVVHSIAELPDGSVLIPDGIDGILYSATKNQDGSWDTKEEDKGLQYRDITCISVLPNGDALALGAYNELYQATKKNGNWRFEFIGELDDPDGITSISALPDGSALITGFSGTLYNVKKMDGSWDIELIGNLIEGEITSISTLPDGSALIAGLSGVLYNVKKMDGSWGFEFIGELDDPDGITPISTLPDGSALIAGFNGALYNVKKMDGSWDIELIKEFKDDGIISISTLPDGSALIAGCLKPLYYATKNDGGWSFELIDKFHDYDKKDFLGDIGSITPLQDGSALVSVKYTDASGSLSHIIPPMKNVRILKQRLGEIVEKGNH